MKKENVMKKEELVKVIKENKSVVLNEDVSYKVVKLNEEEVAMTEGFKKELQRKGLYDNSYTGTLILTIFKDYPVPMEQLRIFETYKGYSYSHIKNTIEEVIDEDYAEGFFEQ